MRITTTNNLLNILKEKKLKISKIILSVALVTTLSALPNNIALAKGARGSTHSSHSSSAKTKITQNSGKNPKANNTAKNNDISKSINTSETKITTGNPNNLSPINTPWFYYYFLITHNPENEKENKIDEKEYYTIKDITYNEEKSKLFQTDYYNISFENGISTSEALQILNNKIHTENEYIYLNIENTNIEVPVKKSDLKSWINSLPEKTNSKTYTK